MLTLWLLVDRIRMSFLVELFHFECLAIELNVLKYVGVFFSFEPSVLPVKFNGDSLLKELLELGV